MAMNALHDVAAPPAAPIYVPASARSCVEGSVPGRVQRRAPAALRRPGLPPQRRQRGVVLFISLIILVAMTLAGIAMFRQVGTGVIIAGNLAFKENATAVGDLGIEGARAWLIAQSSATLDFDQAPAYYSCALPLPPGSIAPVCAQLTFDAATYDWTNSVQQTADDGTGNRVRYVIHRLCSDANASVNTGAQACVTLGSTGSGGSKGGGGYGVLPLANTVQPYFRVTARVDGPRNTLSFVQMIMY